MTTPSRRILHVSQPVSEGVAVVLAHLAEHQSHNGWDVHVACPPQGWLPQELRSRGITVHAWDAGRSPNLAALNETRALRTLIRSVNPGVVHLHSSKAGLSGRLAMRGDRVTIFQPHAWSFHASSGPIAQLSRRWERQALRWTDLVVAVSQDELDEAASYGIVPKRTVVARNGVDLERFQPKDRDAARERLGLGPGPLAVCVGRLARQKGQDLLLDAWSSVAAAVPEAHLALVGDGPDRELLADRIKLSQGSAQLFGITASPEDWYTAADIVVVPSRWEGMALVPLEAMACGRSVVGFDVAGLAESVGDAGAVVPTGDSRALGDEITRRLQDPELTSREGDTGRRRVIDFYDRRKAAAATDEAIRGLMEGLPSRIDTAGGYAAS